MIGQHQYGCYEGEEIRYGHTKPHSVQFIPMREQRQAGEQEKQLAGKRKEDGYFRFSDRLEELGDDDLCAYHRE